MMLRRPREVSPSEVAGPSVTISSKTNSRRGAVGSSCDHAGAHAILAAATQAASTAPRFMTVILPRGSRRASASADMPRSICERWRILARTSLVRTRIQPMRRSDRVVPRLGLDGDPAQLGESVDPRLAAEAAIARGLHAPERHLRLVLHGRPVDVADARLDLARHPEPLRNVAGEHR